MNREYKTLRALRYGEIVDIEGIKLRMAEGEIAPGDLYVAERNTGPKLLTAKVINFNIIIPTDGEYPYSINECVKVKEVQALSLDLTKSRRQT